MLYLGFWVLFWLLYFTWSCLLFLHLKCFWQQGSCVAAALHQPQTNQSNQTHQLEGCMPCISLFLNQFLTYMLFLLSTHCLKVIISVLFLWNLEMLLIITIYLDLCGSVLRQFYLWFYYLQARRRRGRTPTPGRYLGLRTVRCNKDFL